MKVQMEHQEMKIAEIRPLMRENEILYEKLKTTCGITDEDFELLKSELLNLREELKVKNEEFLKKEIDYKKHIKELKFKLSHYGENSKSTRNHLNVNEGDFSERLKNTNQLNRKNSSIDGNIKINTLINWQNQEKRNNLQLGEKDYKQLEKLNNSNKVQTIEFNILSSMKRRAISQIPSQDDILLSNYKKSYYINKLVYKNHNFPPFQSSSESKKKELINNFEQARNFNPRNKNRNRSVISVISDNTNNQGGNQIDFRQFILSQVNKNKIITIPPSSLSSARRNLKASISSL